MKLRLSCLDKPSLWFYQRLLVSDLLELFLLKQQQPMWYLPLPKCLEREESSVNSLNSSDQVVNHLLLLTEPLLLTCHQSTEQQWDTSQLMIKQLTILDQLAERLIMSNLLRAILEPKDFIESMMDLKLIQTIQAQSWN